MSSNKQTHILIVEDDLFLGEIYQKKFEMEGFKVSTANNGEKAVLDIKKKMPDVVLLDILLPKLDGFFRVGTSKGRCQHQRYSSYSAYQSGAAR
jgi:DNA-binding response OmpR family regulator